jgi:hypothetical protein
MYLTQSTSQYNPVYEFHSDRVDITLQLPDDYKIRDEILLNLQRNSAKWFELALSRAPMELQSTLQVTAAVTLPYAVTKLTVFPRNTSPLINRCRLLTRSILAPQLLRIMER